MRCHQALAQATERHQDRDLVRVIAVDRALRGFAFVLHFADMAQTDFERLTRIILDEFGRVHERFDDHDDRFDHIDDKFANVRADLKQLRSELDDLSEKVDNILGYRKEIDHALERISAIEKKLAA
jgi:septal ring factor EnvC (AmiA/AmiB activator)